MLPWRLALPLPTTLSHPACQYGSVLTGSFSLSQSSRMLRAWFLFPPEPPLCPNLTEQSTSLSATNGMDFISAAVIDRAVSSSRGEICKTIRGKTLHAGFSISRWQHGLFEIADALADRWSRSNCSTDSCIHRKHTFVYRLA